MIYLASPYTAKTTDLMIINYERVLHKTHQMIAEGLPVFSPIVHCHAITLKYELPETFEFWQKYCLGLLSASSSLAVYKMPGWDVSVGVKAEIDYAKEMGIPVTYIEFQSTTKI